MLGFPINYRAVKFINEYINVSKKLEFIPPKYGGRVPVQEAVCEETGKVHTEIGDSYPIPSFWLVCNSSLGIKIVSTEVSSLSSVYRIDNDDPDIGVSGSGFPGNG